tara:strand:+ start:2219 stop:3685 length:1467 start_codon:yes stop_codon:yes gene_type:complete
MNFKKFDVTKTFSNERFLAETFVNIENDNIIFNKSTELYYYSNKWVLLGKDDKYNELNLIIYNVLYKYLHNIFLNEDDHSKNKEFEKHLKFISKNTNLGFVRKTVISILYGFQQSIYFDKTNEQIYNIHFNNGVYEINNKKFRNRKKTDYVTQILDYNFIENKDDIEQQYKEVKEVFRKIHPKEQDLKMSLSFLAYCLTGSTDYHHFKMNIGYSASNGKSTEIKIHQKCFDIYTDKLDKNTFTMGYNKRHKEFHRLLTSPVRLCYCEELDQNRLDVDCIKQFVDGSTLDVEQLFGTKLKGINESKFMTTSNKDFNSYDMDKGFQRRGLVQHYESQFLKECLEDDNNKNIYPIDYKLEYKFNNEKYKNAYFYLLLDHYQNELVVDQIYKDNFISINEQYDEFSSLLYEQYEKNPNCCISKEKIKSYFEQKDKKYKWARILSNLKKLGFKYDKDKQINYKKGIIIGLRELDFEGDDTDIDTDEDVNPLDL